MVNRSIKGNFVLSLLNTFTGLLFPLITFPYASRILLAEGIGQVQFFQSIIEYISLIVALGIPLYAVREVSKIRDHEEQLSLITTELLLLHSLLTLIGYLIVFIIIGCVTKVQSNIPLFLLLSTTLLFNNIGASWLYQAVEDFKFITIRSITIRIVSLLLLFIFVKTKNDLFSYAAILVLGTVGNNIFNFLRLKKYVSLKLIRFNQINIKRHIKPALRVFLLNITISLYININVIMLGFISGDESVGYYTATTKFITAMQSIVTALGVVLLPRFSNMINSGDIEGFRNKSNKVISFVLALCLPISFATIFLSTPIIMIFCGSGFEPSIITLQLIAPKILFSCLAYIIGVQIAYPLGKENMFVLATTAGAIVNIVFNIFLLKEFADRGAAISTTLAELTVFIFIFSYCRKYFSLHIYTKQNLNYFISSILMCIPLVLFYVLDNYNIKYGLLSACIASFIYISYLLLKKDFLLIEIKEFLIKIIKK